jgi:alpha-1,2-mannosyltransferase
MTSGLTTLLVRAAYAVALICAVAWALLILSSAAAQGTLGFDYKAYDLAVDNLLAGRPMYDPNAQQTGSFGLFFYPPPFALLVAPFALLPVEQGVVGFTTLLVLASVTAIAILPLTLRVRLIVLLLAALSWPLVYAIKLGQVGPLILLTFAIGWRWMDSPWRLGLATALGTVIKIQPALVIGWALQTGRLRAAAIAVGAAGAISLVATLAAGPQSWFQEADLLRRVSQPVLTPHAFGVGRLLYEAGMPEGLAMAFHVLNLVLIAMVAFWATIRATPVASYLAIVVASQFISPVLWDHYALVLLLPTAWLLSRGRWWAVLIPLSTATFLVGISVPAIYPIAFWAALLGVTWLGTADARDQRRTRASNQSRGWGTG